MQGSSRSKLYEELGRESLCERRWCRRILQIHEIVSNKTPPYLKDKLDTADICTVNTIITIRFVKDAALRDTWTVSFQMQLLGIMLSHSVTIFHQSISLKTIFYLWFVRRKIIFFGIHDASGLRSLLQLGGLKFLKISQKCHNCLIFLVIVFANTVLQILIIFYFRVLFSLLKEQP